MSRTLAHDTPVGQPNAATPDLRPGHAHVWQANLGAIDYAPPGVLDALSSDERVRADRFAFARDRDNFVLRRYMLRRLLGRYLDVAPDEVRFRYGASGKPALAGAAGTGGLRFNLSRSGAVVLCAIALDRDVGIDVERVRADFPAGDIVDRFFSRREAAAFLRCPPAAQCEAFFACWTRKEACIKAAGGTLNDLSRIEVPVSPLVCCVDVDAQNPLGSGHAVWRLHDVRTYEGFRAALVVEAPVRVWGPFEWDITHLS